MDRKVTIATGRDVTGQFSSVHSSLRRAEHKQGSRECHCRSESADSIDPNFENDLKEATRQLLACHGAREVGEPCQVIYTTKSIEYHYANATLSTNAAVMQLRKHLSVLAVSESE